MWMESQILAATAAPSFWPLAIQEAPASAPASAALDVSVRTWDICPTLIVTETRTRMNAVRTRQATATCPRPPANCHFPRLLPQLVGGQVGGRAHLARFRSCGIVSPHPLPPG